MVHFIEIREPRENYHQIQIFIKKRLEYGGIDFYLKGDLKYGYDFWSIRESAEDSTVKYIDTFLMEASEMFPKTLFEFRFTDPSTYDLNEETEGHFFKSGNKEVVYYD